MPNITTKPAMKRGSRCSRAVESWHRSMWVRYSRAAEANLGCCSSSRIASWTGFVFQEVEPRPLAADLADNKMVPRRHANRLLSVETVDLPRPLKSSFKSIHWPRAYFSPIKATTRPTPGGYRRTPPSSFRLKSTLCHHRAANPYCFAIVRIGSLARNIKATPAITHNATASNSPQVK